MDSNQTVVDYIKSLTSKEFTSIDGLDVYFEDLKFGVELMGLSTHNETARPLAKKYSVQKATKAKLQGEKFLSIFEDEWNNPVKRELIQKMIQYRLGIVPQIKLRASKLELRKLSTGIQAKDFFNQFHLDGHTNAAFAYGLFHDGILVSCMSFRKSFSDKSWEIARFANNYNYLVHGNAGRLLKEYKRDIGERLITFSNNRLSIGGVYQKLGFKEITKTIDPSYYYTDLEQRLWRFKCKRINDPEIIAEYPTEKAQALGGVFSRKFLGHSKPLYKIYDYGHRKWELV